MDPNETLRVIRESIPNYDATADENSPNRDLIDAVTDLDDWITSGGFLPGDWSEV